MKFVGKVVGLIGKLRVLWKEWDIRSFVMASFSIQILLILVAPLRKRTCNMGVIWATWLGYLLADWVAVQAVGLIMKGSGAKSELLALWAQFLLIHLGGPDTITALAIEDTALWLRTGLNLCTQVYSTLGILARSASGGVWTALLGSIFLAGIIKYVERVAALLHGRLSDGIEEEPGAYVEELREGGGAGAGDVQLARHSFCLFQLYRRIYADLKLDPTVRRVVRHYMLQRTPEEAYKLVEIHLTLLYESIYTKASVLHRSTLWRILRHLAFLLQLAGLALWCFSTTKPNYYSDLDIRITNALFIGGISVECFAFFRIQISDWNISCRRRRHPPGKIKRWLYNKILSARYVVLPAAADDGDPANNQKLRGWMRRVFLTRWSHSIHAINRGGPPGSCLLYLCPENFYRRFSLVLFLVRNSMTSKTELSSEMWGFIFEVLTKPPCDNTAVHTLPNSNDLLPTHLLVARALPLQILDYHIVADTWGDIIPISSSDDDDEDDDDDDDGDSGGSADNYYLYLDISKTIASYLIYLYTLQPNMMFGAAGIENVLRHYYDGWVIKTTESTSISVGEAEVELDDGSSCKFGILSSELVTNTDDVRLKAEQQMKEVFNYLKDGEKWEVIARVWVELLCHTAINCRPSVHAAQLKEGGEFLSFVWLLMLHLGIGPETLPRP